jgi:uncharacterized protein (TIGR02300 family)
VAKPELGTKRVCPTTGRKFYDLNKDPVISPYSGESWPRASFEPLVKAARGKDTDDDEDEVAAETGAAAAEFVPLEDIDAEDGKDIVTDDIEIDDEIAAPGEDDTFLEEEEEGEDDVSGLIDGEIEGDEES